MLVDAVKFHFGWLVTQYIYICIPSKVAKQPLVEYQRFVYYQNSHTYGYYYNIASDVTVSSLPSITRRNMLIAVVVARSMFCVRMRP